MHSNEGIIYNSQRLFYLHTKQSEAVFAAMFSNLIMMLGIKRENDDNK